ncbi:MAG: Flp pilus assembly protein CpaB [Myxococcaceae bacterium]
MLKGKSPLLVALALGLLAGIVAYSAIKKQESDLKKRWDTVAVVVADKDIPEGTTLTIDMYTQRPIPVQFVTSSVVVPERARYIENQKILVPVQRGDPLLWSHFETTKVERLSTRVQKKARAVTISADQNASVGGWVRPNDHVDVIGTFRDPQSNEQVAVTLLQNVIVLATGNITGTTNVNLIPESKRDYNNVSLLVLPEEAEILTLAAELGTLRLSLRHEDDVDVIEDRGRATIHTLLSGERTRVLEEKRRGIIQIIKGNASVAGQQ